MSVSTPARDCMQSLSECEQLRTLVECDWEHPSALEWEHLECDWVHANTFEWLLSALGIHKKHFWLLVIIATSLNDTMVSLLNANDHPSVLLNNNLIEYFVQDCWNTFYHKNQQSQICTDSVDYEWVLSGLVTGATNCIFGPRQRCGRCWKITRNSSQIRHSHAMDCDGRRVFETLWVIKINGCH